VTDARRNLYWLLAEDDDETGADEG